jgi:hypothetical protein
MKNIIFKIIILFMFIGLHHSFAQVAAKKGWDGTIKGGTIHIELDAQGNTIFYLPCAKPTALVVEDGSYKVVSPRDAASGLATGKRQHKPFTISKQTQGTTFGEKSTLVCEDGECDISTLEAGTYQVCAGAVCFSFTKPKQYTGHVTLMK